MDGVVPKRLAVLGLEPSAFQANQARVRTACEIKPLPFYWLGEVLREVFECDVDRITGSRFDVGRLPVLDPRMQAMQELVRSRYVLLSNVPSERWHVIDGDDRAVLAHEMLDLAEREDVPEGSRIAMAGRLIERASRVPGRVVFSGL